MKMKKGMKKGGMKKGAGIAAKGGTRTSGKPMVLGKSTPGQRTGMSKK